VNVYWTDTAVENLEAIHAYIAQNSLQYANQVVDRIIGRSEQLANFPLSGRILPEVGRKEIRELIEGSYRIIYSVKSEQIDILAVIHGSRSLTRPE